MKTLHTIYSTFAKHNMAKFLTVLTILFTVGIGQMLGETATNNCGSALSTTATDMESGKLIQWKVSSTNSYSNPIRVYANTTITITAKSGVKRITQVEVTAYSTGNYVTYTKDATWTASGTGTCTVGTKSVSGKVITVPMNGDVTKVTIKPSSQTRWSKVVVTYELDASCDKKVTLTKGSETNGTFTLDKANDSYDNCDADFVVKVSDVQPKSNSQYCSGINVTGGNSTVTGPVDGVWTVTYAKENNITSTITPVFANKASASIDFVNMGIPAPTTTGYYVGDTYTLPSENNFTCGDKTFVGWSTVTIDNSVNKPTSNFYEPGASVTLAATNKFYAVFAEGGGEEVVTSISGGDWSSGVSNGWTTSGTGTYSGNGVKFDGANDYVLSPDISSKNYSELLLKFKSGYNGSKGSVLTFYAYNKDKTLLADENVTISPKTVIPDVVYTSQNTTYEVSISANEVIGQIMIKMTSKTSNLGMKYCEIFGVSSSYQNYTTECSVAQTAYYTVKHYQQNITDDNYTLIETQTLSGEVGTSVTPDVKTYTGFKAPSTKTVTINADGKTVVEYYYTRNSYTLTWNLDGGTISTQGTAAGEVKYGAALTAPTVTKTDYTFAGWSPAVASTMPAANTTYTAQWTQLHTITWMVGSNSVLTEEVANATGVTQTPADPDPANNAIGNCANAFVGWSESNLGSAEGQSAPADLCTAAQMKSKYTSVTSDKIFYAVFATAEETTGGTVEASLSFASTAHRDSQTSSKQVWSNEGITFTNNKGSSTTDVANYSNPVRLYKNSEIIVEHTSGEITKIVFDCNSSSYATALKNSIGTPNSNTTVTASSDKVTVTFANAVASFSAKLTSDQVRLDALTVTAGGGIITTYSNYVTNCCELLPVTNLQVSGVTEKSATLTWTKPSSTTDITELQIRNADNDAVVVDDINPTTTTATIDGLYECTKYNYYVVSVGAECEVSSETITAQPFSGAKTVTFNYNGNGQANTTSSTSCGNTSITLPTPTWAGYRFMGWYTAANGGDKVNENPYTPTSDIPLYAHWAKEYSVTYNANGGSTTCANDNYIEGETVTLCTSTPSKTGYTFAGWTYSPEVTITDGKFTMPASDVTITAQWQVKSYTVTWNPNGGNWGSSTASIVETYEYGATIVQPAAPQRDSYRFTGWSPAVSATMPAGNKTYTAQWKQNYTITFYDGDDVTPWTQTAAAESIDLNTYVGTRACGDYNFAGWSTDATQYNDQTANITTWVTGIYTPTANIDLYAVYVKGAIAEDFKLNCEGGVYKIWEKGTNKHMAGRQNDGGNNFYTTEYWDQYKTGSNGAPFTITKVADQTYTLQNADGQYITGNSYDEDDLNIEDTWESADKYKWTISAGSNGTWRFTNKASSEYALVFYDKYFQLRKATNVKLGSDYYDLELTPAASNVYQSNPNCGPYYIIFNTHGGEFIRGEEYPYGEEQTGLTETTYAKFPAAELEGYTFAGWKDGSPIDDEITADNASDAPYLKQAGEDLVVSSNKTYHAVYYYYDEEEDIDFSKEFTTSIYAEVNGMKYFLAGTPSSGTMSSTTDCGYVSEVTITPGTGANAGKYKITVNGVAMAPKTNETDLVNGTYWWTITERSVGSGEYKISGQDKKNIVLLNSSWGHYTYNQGSEYGNNYYYPRFGKCLQHHWTSKPPIKLTVTYDPNGATSGTAPIDSHYYMEDDKVYVLGPNDLQKENYAFVGWNTQADGEGEDYEEGEYFNITKKTTLYAQWDCATYVNITKGTPVNGTFNLSVTGTQYTCEDGFVVSVTDIVPATGYRFDHITQEGVDAANVEINNDDKTVTYKQLSNGSSTINVVFAAMPYTVTWDPNGGNWGGSTDNKVETYNYGASITKPADPTRTGYTFAGWSPTPASSMPAENVTYTALWTANTNTLYVVEHYQQNLDLSYPTTPTEQESFTGTTDTKVTPTVKTYEGFTSPATQEVTIAADGSLVVRYEYKRNSYKLTWDLAGGTITTAGTAAGSVLFGAELKAPRVAKVDNVFMGWEPEVPATMPAHDATYVAQWIELTNFRTFCKNSVTWVVNGGKWADGTTADIVDIYTRGQEIIPPTDPTLEGWKFMGWDPEFVEGTTMQGNDHIYTAQWAKAYTVTYDANGGSTTCEDNNEYVANDIVTVCNSRPTKAGYTFASWMRSDNNAIVQPDATFAMPENDVTLIAQWTANTNTPYVVEHYQQALDGTYPTPTEREELTGTTDTQVIPAVKSYSGFTAPATQTVTIAAAGNLVVKYQYTRNSYTLAWDLDGGTVTTAGTAEGSVLFGASLTAPVVEKVGCTFKAWEPSVPTTMPANDATYKAIWEVASHTVTWDPDGGHWNGDHNKKVETYNYGDPIVKPANPEKTGYVFYEWKPEVAETMQNDNLTYTAEWKPEYCQEYSFHWGNGTDEQVKVDNYQACFTQVGNTHEWQVTHFTIPAENKYFVGYKGWWYNGTLGLGDNNGQYSKSVMKEWTWTGDQVIYLALVGRGYTLGHATGAVGTLRIYDNSSMDNLDVAFIPDGYGITLTSNSSGAKTPYAFRTTTVDHKWETDVLKMPGITNNKYTVGLKTQGDEYVASNHSKAPENLEKMGVTEVVQGKKMISFKPGPWNVDDAKFAIWDATNSKWGDGTNKLLTDSDGDGVYEGYVASTCTKINLVRLNKTTTTTNISWDLKWNQTNDIELSTDGLARVYTINGWEANSFIVANASPKTDQNGKFRIWDNSGSQNWFVHFIPYYLLNYDANGGSGEMAVVEYNTEDAKNKVTVAANEFTRTGYDFVAWNTKADGTGTTYNPGDLFTMTADATIYAIWKAQDYQITYKDQGDEDYSGSNEAELPKTHTYGKATELVDGEKIGYTFEGWYDNQDCTGDAITKLGAKDYTADITLYAKWTFAMEYDITNTETIYITSAKKQTVKATTQLTLQVGNMPVGTTIDIAAPHITFYDDAGKPVTQLTTKYNPETFSLAVAYTPEDENTTEQPTITLSVLGHEKAFDIISVRSLPATFAIVAKVGSMWYALPSQGLSSTSDLVGYPVEVDNQDDPTEVRLIPTNADWSLYGVYQSSGSNDRFAANGGNILFVNGEANALNASRKDGYVLTEAGYGSYQTTTSPDLYEWKPTTTDLETYQLTNANRTDRNLSIDILTRFGVYKGEIENLRFLPIKERYTLASFQVVEWKENSLVIMYNGNPAQTATIAIDGTTNIGSANLSDVNKDFAIYELPAAGLVNNATKRILITIGTEQKWLTVPYIISGEKTDAEVVASTSADIVTATDVFILKDAKFTATATSKNSQYRFRNVTVYGGGKLVIGSGKFLSMNSIILRAGGITDAGEYDYVYPQFDFQGTLTNSAGEFKYDYITDYEHWYHLVLPFDGKIKSPSIKYPVEFYGNNVSATNSGSWVVKRYDGATRATGNYDAWVDIETEGKDVITAGHGYIYWGAPKKVKVNGEEKRQKWGIQRIVMEKGWEAARNAEIGNKTISGLGSYANVDNNSGNVYDQGWNLIGNPYMVNLTGLNSKSLKTGKLIEELNANGNWTGGWVLDSINATLRYITVPSDHFEWYEAKRVTKNMELGTGRTFFVQIDGTATDVMFEAANRAQLMPSLLAANNNPVDIETGIVLSNETMQDEVNFWIAEGMTNDYEYNADYPKTLNTTNFNVYGVHTNGYLSWVATGPEFAKESMPIGYQVPAAGTYMLSVSEEYYSDEIDALYVTDHEMSPELTVDLMIAPYEFSVNQAETNNERFTVSLKLKSDDEGTTTGLENTGVKSNQPIKFIYQDMIFIMHNETIYDATGKKVTTINK